MNKAAFCAVLVFAVGGATGRGQASAPSSLSPAKTAAPADATAASPTATPEKKEKAKKSNAGRPAGIPGLATPTGPITTEIYADEASFDSAKYVGVFSGHVIVNDPRFNLQSDKLTVFIKKSGNDAASPASPAPAAGAAAAGGEGLEKAIAEGNVGLVRETADPKGGPPTRAIGRADHAVYTTSDGNIEMTGNPRVQQGLNSHVATSANTVMILNESGQLQTHGSSRTEIRQEPKPPDAAKPPEAPKP